VKLECRWFKELLYRDGELWGSSYEGLETIYVSNPNAGIDAVKLKDGRVVLAYNPAQRGRNVLALAVSHNDGLTFEEPLFLENAHDAWPQSRECSTTQIVSDKKPNNRQSKPKHPNSIRPEYSYPAVIQSPSTGLMHVVYTYSYYGAGGRCDGRESIKHVVVVPCRLSHDFRDRGKYCNLQDYRILNL